MLNVNVIDVIVRNAGNASSKVVPFNLTYHGDHKKTYNYQSRSSCSGGYKICKGNK